MTRYQELINQLQVEDVEKAEILQDEIDIIIHKLKFLPRDNFPKTIVLDQANAFEPLSDDLLAEKINIAGGRLITSLDEGAELIIIKQADEALYGELPTLLSSTIIKSSYASKADRVYIISSTDFHTSDEHYLADVEILAEILQPKYFVYGRDGQDWVKFSIA